MSTLPEFVLEWIGRTVSQRLDGVIAEYRAALADLKVQNAELRLAHAELTAKLERQYQEAFDVIDARLSEIKDGRDGEKGEKGDPGEKGDKGETGERGEKGDPGVQGDAGPEGKEGPIGQPGRDGLPGRDGEKGKDGADGINGKDGFGFENLNVDFDGERTVVLNFVRGDEIKTFPVKFPIPIDRGVFVEGRAYERGDGVTWGGSFWIAQKDAPQGKPDSGNGDWRLTTKRGRDGK